MKMPVKDYIPLVLVDTENLPRDEWLEWRRKGIGGSDAATIIGVSPFSTARDLYYDKLNIVSAVDDEDNWVQKEIGHLLEDLVAKIFSKKTGYPVYQVKKMFYHPEYTADSEDPWEYYYFAFNGAFSAELLERSVFRKNHFIQKNCNDELISKIIEASYAIREAKNPDLIGLEYLFKFLTLMSYNEKKTGRKENLHLKYVVPIQQYIEQHYSEPLVTSEFAKMLNIDRTYFYKLFKEYTGLSPEKYIISLRIQRAKLLISATDLPLSTIGNLVGYENYPPFFSMFKKIVGISPNEYRTQINNFPKTYDNGLFESNLE